MSFHLLTFFLTFTSVCIPFVGGIIGGGPVNLYRAYVRVETLDGLCGGTLLAHDMVLTVAHCLFGEDRKPFSNFDIQVVKGDFTTKNWIIHAKRFSCVRFIVHPYYEHHLDHIFNPYDLAIIELEESVDMTHAQNDILKPCVPELLDASSNLEAPEFGYALGMGLIRLKPKFKSPVLKGVRLIHEHYCSMRYGYMERVLHLKGINETNHVCYRSSNLNGCTCEGDTGGPIVHREDNRAICLIGIDISGDAMCDPTMPAVFIRASIFEHWISQTVLTLSKCLTFDASQCTVLKTFENTKRLKYVNT